MISTQNGNVRAPFIQGKGAAQNARYTNGVENNWLTADEQSQLKDARAADLATLNAAKSDGVVNRQERAKICAPLAENSPSFSGTATWVKRKRILGEGEG